MSDNLNKRGPQDASKVNVNEEWELRYWTKKLGVSEEQLKAAVKQVGVRVDALAAHLKSNS